MSGHRANSHPVLAVALSVLLVAGSVAVAGPAVAQDAAGSPVAQDAAGSPVALDDARVDAAVSTGEGSVGEPVEEPTDGSLDDPTDGSLDEPARSIDGSAHTLDDSERSVEADASRGVGDGLQLRTVLSLTPSEPGRVGSQFTFTIPDRVVALRVTLPADARVVDTRGFSLEDGSYVWDGETASPSITASIAANRTAAEGGPLAAGGSYLFVDVGPWAMVREPQVSLHWSRRGGTPVTFTQTLAVEGEGVAGSDMAYLGPSETRTHRAHGQTFTLVVPAAADLAASPSAIFASLEGAAGTLQVGPGDERVLVVAAPTSRVDWAVRGLEVGGADFWVRDGEPLDTPGNVWLHEYVHTRQTFATATSGRWLSEALATWYAALLTLEQGRIGFDAFARFLRIGSTDPQAGAVLAEPDSWARNAHYFKGGLVLGELDRRIRVGTDHEHSLQAVFSRLNGQQDPVENADFLAAVEAVAGAETRRTARQFTTTSAAPEVWDEAAHEAAFGPTPARMAVTVPDNGIRVSGPYRNASLERPIAVATNETLHLGVTVSNVGGAAGDYRLQLVVDGEVVATRTGRLAPGAERTLTVAHTFEEPGSHTVTVGGRTLTVFVAAPSSPRVSDLRAGAATVRPNSTVSVTARLSNPTAVPAVGTLTVRLDGTVVASRHVVLAPGENRTVRVPVALSEPGTHRISVDGERVSVRVATPSPTTTSTTIPGFGAVPGALALALAAVLLLGRD